jgi:hypothetical protein
MVSSSALAAPWLRGSPSDGETPCAGSSALTVLNYPETIILGQSRTIRASTAGWKTNQMRHHLLRWSLSRLHSICAVWLIVVVCSSHASEPLPAEIPAKSLTTKELLQQAARSVERIEDRRERIRTLSLILYDLRRMSRDELQPFIEIVTREAEQPESQELLIGHAECLAPYVPAIVFRIASSLPEGRGRESPLTYVVRACADSNPQMAREALQQIKDPSRRVSALGAFTYRSTNLEEVKKCLIEIKQIGYRPGEQSPPEIYYAGGLEKFLPDRFAAVLDCVKADLSPNSAVDALGHMASSIRFYRQDTATLARLLAAGTEIVPNCENPAKAAESLLYHGYAMHDPAGALRLFDQFIRPTASPETSFSFLGQFADQGVETVVAKAEQLAAATKLHSEDVVPEAIRGAFDITGPDMIIDWLKRSPASSIKDAALEEIAGDLSHYDLTRKPTAAQVQAWVSQLLDMLPSISKPQEKKRAFASVSFLAAKHRLNVSAGIREEYARWLRASNAGRDADSWRQEMFTSIYLLPDNVQREAIDREFTARSARTCAEFVSRSALTADEKRTWYQKLLAQTRALPDRRERAIALSGLGGALWPLDPELSLQVLWESLVLARELNLQPAPQNIDFGPGYNGWDYPVTTADEAMGGVFYEPSDDSAASIRALWIFARKLENVPDREAVLDALSKLLVKQQDYPRAAGIASLITSPIRHARLSAAVAAAQSGKAREE